MRKYLLRTNVMRPNWRWLFIDIRLSFSHAQTIWPQLNLAVAMEILNSGKQEWCRSWIISSTSSPMIPIYSILSTAWASWDGWDGELEILNPFRLRGKGALVHIIHALNDPITRWTPLSCHWRGKRAHQANGSDRLRTFLLNTIEKHWMTDYD